MKRDMDLVRELLLKLEALGSADRVLSFSPDDDEIKPEGFTPDPLASPAASSLAGSCGKLGLTAGTAFATG